MPESEPESSAPEVSSVTAPLPEFPVLSRGEPPLEEAAAVEAWIASLEGCRLALDIEADGMFRYRARLCTVQLADLSRTTVVDSLAAWPIPALSRVLGDTSVTKVVHDVGFDARMLLESGAPLDGVFDTALAARFLGYAETGLAACLDRHFGVQLNKQHQQSDWGVRPLETDALRYLHEDVRYLLSLAEVLERELESAGVVAEYETERDYVLRQAAFDDPEPRAAWMRVKGAGKLRPVGRAVLRELAALRERLAEARDVPPGRLLANVLLIALAERRPTSAAQLDKLVRRSRLDPVERGQVLEAIERGISAGEVPRDELARFAPPAPSAEERARHKRRRDALTAFRRQESEDRGVDPQVVLPGHCLKALCAVGRPDPEEAFAVDGLGQCRVERYGAALCAALLAAETP